MTSLSDIIGESFPMQKTKRDIYDLSDIGQETVLRELRAMQERYAAPPIFKPGDLVTPTKVSGTHGHGAPHIVLEVRENFNAEVIETHNIEDAGSPMFGRIMDIRVAAALNVDGELRIVEYWMERAGLEKWSEPSSS